MVPPLPYRPLEVRGHGVYDPVREALYPYRVVRVWSIGNTTLLPAKPGIMRFVHSMTVKCLNGNNTGSVWPYIVTQGYVATSPDTSVFLVTVHAMPSDGTTEDHGEINAVLDVLLAPGTPVSIVHGAGAQYGDTTCTYAEIPVDEGEV